MRGNVSEILPNSTSNTNLVMWRCFGTDEEILSLDNGFQVNVFLLASVNIFSAIFSLLANSLVICGTYRNKSLGKISKVLSILLAIDGVLTALVIQPLYVTAKFIMLANIYSPSNIRYCMFMFIVASGTKILVGVSIAAMLGITAERYAAVIYPYQYIVYKRNFLKLVMFMFLSFLAHFVVSDIWTWYKNISKILTALLTIIAYVFTVYAYGKIYFKLKDLDMVGTGSSNHHGAASIRIGKKRQSLTSFLVVASYLVCYFPLIVIRSLNLDKESLVVQLYLQPWFVTLLFCSFSASALLYGWRSVEMLQGSHRRAYIGNVITIKSFQS